MKCKLMNVRYDNFINTDNKQPAPFLRVSLYYR